MDAVLELLLPCELRGLTPRTKVFSGMFPFKHQYHPSSHQLKHNIFVYFLCLSLNLFRTFPTCVFCYIWLCILEIIFMELLVAFLLWYTHCESCSNEHSFNRIHFSHTVTSVWERQNTSGWVVRCSVLKYKHSIPSDTTL